MADFDMFWETTDRDWLAHLLTGGTIEDACGWHFRLTPEGELQHQQRWYPARELRPGDSGYWEEGDDPNAAVWPQRPIKCLPKGAL